ncbi:MAG: hypothetical protein AAFZ18_15030 [Myxococcota bacterium]
MLEDLDRGFVRQLRFAVLGAFAHAELQRFVRDHLDAGQRAEVRGGSGRPGSAAMTPIMSRGAVRIAKAASKPPAIDFAAAR